MVRLSGQPIGKWFIYSWGIIDVVSSLASCLLLLPKAIFYQHCSVSSLTPKQNTKKKEADRGQERKEASELPKKGEGLEQRTK